MRGRIFRNALLHLQRLLVVALFGLVVLTSVLPANNQVSADTAPPSGTPATVSADALPTTQVNGIVWAQTIVGNTVYATGRFTTARPAGVAEGGAGTVSRANLLAYDITTGNLLPFNHALNGEGRAITVSPDNTKLYVGGSFTTVDGQPHANLAEFDVSTGKLVSTFTSGVNNTVRAVTASNSVVYAGGSFNQANGVSRVHLAAFLTNGALTGWIPSTNAQVEAMILTPDMTKVIVGGPFTQLNGQTYYGMGALSVNSPGTALAWASQSATYPIRDVDLDKAAASITSFSKNADTIFLTAFNAKDKLLPGGLEGPAAISPADGHVIWLDDCYGDTYSAVPIGSVLYSVGHAHDCSPIGAFPEAAPQRVWHLATAQTITVDGVNGPPPPSRTSFQGLPRSSQLDWYPNLAAGNVSGANQAAWSITGNTNYVALGGEFPLVNGMAQQGLVRFAVSSASTNKEGPRNFGTTAIQAHTVGTSGTAAIRLATTWDPDNAVLRYNLYRDNATAPITSYTVDSRFWNLPVHMFQDTGLVAGSSHTYRLTATDPFGNTVTTDAIANTANFKTPGDWDGDGQADFATFKKITTSSPQAIYWYTNPSNYTVPTGYGVPTDMVTPADYNGDGRSDIAVYRPSTYNWYIRTIAQIKYGNAGAIPVPGDYLGNGKATPAIFNPNNGYWYVDGMGSAISYGTKGDVPVPGDYNGDGKTDIAVWRPSTNSLYVRTIRYVHYGTAGDIPVPADYNGDGITDLAVFRPSNGTWYISTNFLYTTQIISYGTNGDIPAPADYNGDGKADAAVFRPSNNTYYFGGSGKPVTGTAPLALPYAIGKHYFPTKY